MKRRYFILFLLFPCLVIAQQPSQADLEKMQKDAQQKANAVMNDPKYQKYIGNNNAGNMMNIPSNPFSLQKPDTAFLSKMKTPEKNVKALASIPVKPMSKADLKYFLADIKKKLGPVVQSSYGTRPLSTSGKSATAVSGEAVLAFYAGKPEYALLLGMESVSLDPENENALNNDAAILSLCGFPYKAVPILDYLKEQEPDNSTVNNNLGQAYLMMGDILKALDYLRQAVAATPYHPNANMSLAYISYLNGDKSAAAAYCKNCLRGGFVSQAWNMLKAIKPDVKLMDYIRHRYKQPETFNEHKYELLPQCRTVDEVAKLQILYPEYNSMLMRIKSKYDKMANEEGKLSAQNIQNNIMQKVSQGGDPMRPFGWFANTLLGDIAKTHAENLLEMDKYDKQFEEKLKELNDDYEVKKKEVNDKYGSSEVAEGSAYTDNSAARCNAVNELNNTFLPEFADLREAWQKKWLYEERDYFNDASFWCYVASLDDHQYRKNFYQLVSEYLGLMIKLNHTRLIACLHKNADTTHKKPDSLQFQEGKCPLAAKIPVKQLSSTISLDCNKMGLDAEIGEGVSLKATHSFSGSTTLALEAGVPLIPKVVSGSMQFYITFGGGAPMDIGVKWEAEMKLPEALGGTNSAGWGLGLNSGVSFTGEGRLQAASSNWIQQNVFGLDPPPPQINPNVKMFNTSNGSKE